MAMAERKKQMSDDLTPEFIIEQAKRSHAWMLKTIQHNSDVTSGGNYSDDLQHAIAVQEMLDMIEKGSEI